MYYTLTFNWVNLYSIQCLAGILQPEHLECWGHFVLAFRILCRHSLSSQKIALADALLLHFCKRTENMYGRSLTTPSMHMHMHCHLREVLLDYGPVYSYWLFSFVRYNGILGSQPTNNRSIEAQLMQRFIYLII